MKNIAVIVALGPFLLFATPALAHPGRTASDGCHYCRTNCDSWGVAWNTRHCHGGNYVAPAPVYNPPTQAPTTKPTIKPTIKPTAAPTLTPTSLPEATVKPSQSPMVEGTSTGSNSSVLGGLIGMGIFLFGGYKGLKWLARKTA